MSHVNQTIEELEEQIQQKQRELDDLQITVNNLYKHIGLAPKYKTIGSDAELSALKLRGDEYFRRPTATVITQILQDRKARNMGPANIDEIQEKMLEGGYVFDVKEPKKAIGTAMGKNTKFTKVGEKWGLTEWYPKVKEQKEDAAQEEESNDNETNKEGSSENK